MAFLETEVIQLGRLRCLAVFGVNILGSSAFGFGSLSTSHNLDWHASPKLQSTRSNVVLLNHTFKDNLS
jgi:hypothetical protein